MNRAAEPKASLCHRHAAVQPQTIQLTNPLRNEETFAKF